MVAFYADAKLAKQISKYRPRLALSIDHLLDRPVRMAGEVSSEVAHLTLTARPSTLLSDNLWPRGWLLPFLRCLEHSFFVKIIHIAVSNIKAY